MSALGIVTINSKYQRGVQRLMSSVQVQVQLPERGSAAAKVSFVEDEKASMAKDQMD